MTDRTDDTPTIPGDAREFAVTWWAERWEKDGSRDAFATALRETLSRPIPPQCCFADGTIVLAVDHDPNEALLPAVQAVEPECRGFMFSARGLLPGKTRMRIERDRVRVCEGYRASWEEVWRR